MHSTFVPEPRRPPTSEEKDWVEQIVSANPLWANVDLGDLFVIGRCDCGCRTVVFEQPSQVQNPSVSHQKDLVGDITIRIQKGDADDYISVLLHHSQGNLLQLEVIWYNFPEPVPERWVELDRTVSSAD